MMETRKLNYKLFTLVFTFAVLFAFSGNAQEKDSSGNIIDKTAAQIFITDGKKKLFEGNIRGALIKFREAIQKDKGKASAYFWTAMCHFELNNYDYALQYCDDAIKIDTLADKEVLYLRGAILHKQNKLDEAIASYEKSLIYVTAARIKDLRIKERIEQCKRAQIAMKDAPNIPIKVLGREINSRFPDYAPVVADSGRTIYYTSRRQNTTGSGMNPYDNLFYEDIYVSTIDEDGEWTRGENDNEAVVRLNTAGFDAVNDISADGTMLYLTVNTDEMDIKPKTKSSDICLARQSKKDKWNTPKAVNGDVNSKYFDGSITMTGDGSRAYFVTERKDKEALGRTDIWFANVSNGRSFKEVKIMDKTINTKYDENTCFVSRDGMYLFFSSRGHEGFGGYDIFVTKNMGDTWTIPVNIGYPINTTDDDLHFKWYPELKKGYYSTIPKEDGKGDRDIVEIDFSNFDFKAHIEKLIEDKQNEAAEKSEPEEETEVQPKTIEGKTNKTPAVK